MKLVVVVMLAIAGCRQGPSERLQKLEKFADAMCACRDKACADQVVAEMTKWGEQASKTADQKIPNDEVQKAEKSASKLSDCYSKLVNGMLVTPEKAAP